MCVGDRSNFSTSPTEVHRFCQNTVVTARQYDDDDKTIMVLDRSGKDKIAVLRKSTECSQLGIDVAWRKGEEDQLTRATQFLHCPSTGQ